jgi:hypothetical protein
VEQVDTLKTAVQGGAEPTGPTVEMPVAELTHATQQVTEAVGQVEAIKMVTQEPAEPNGPEEREVIVEELDHAARQMKQAAECVDTLIT